MFLYGLMISLPFSFLYMFRARWMYIKQLLSRCCLCL
jgi:hypothetical protein